jgi:hypothetical protein
LTVPVEASMVCATGARRHLGACVVVDWGTETWQVVEDGARLFWLEAR